MATKAHCAYCFDTLAASFERSQPLSLSQIQKLWDECYLQEANDYDADDDHDEEVDGDEAPSSSSARPAAISRLLNRVTSTNSSSSTLTSTSSSQSDKSTPATSQSSSRSDLLSPEEKCPLFITWNTISPLGNKALRGCIGTFEAQPLEHGLRSYALTSAFDDHRFSPIPKDLLPRLQCCVTLLTNFSKPTKDPMDWTIGTHGIRISFTANGRRLGATYLPDVALEQGWNKEEAIVSLMRKAGWTGKKTEWTKVSNLELVRYEGKKVSLVYHEYKEFKAWLDNKGVEA